MRAIVTEKIHPGGIELLKQHLTVDCKFGISRAELLQEIHRYTALVGRVAIRIDTELLDLGKNLQAVCAAGIGLDHMDTAYAKEKGVSVINVPEGSVDAVAELTIVLMLTLSRRIDQAIDAVKTKKEWNKHHFVGRQLKGKVLGLVALGNIGRRVAHLASAFGMEVLAYDPYIEVEEVRSMGIEPVELEDLLQNAQIISIHAPLTPRTHHLIGRKELGMMNGAAYLLNLGRGGIIDEEALYLALKEKKIAGAALDVMEKEPPGESPLFQLDNFIATPHIGSGTQEAQEYISRRVAEQLLECLGIVD